MSISQYDVLNYANYKPASLQDMFAPAEAMRQQEDKLQEEYSQQGQLGSMSLNNIDKIKDKKAYDIKQNYIQQTKDAADLLATKGFIDSGRRRNLMDIKTIYNNQVVPYMNALAVRQAKSSEYSKTTTDHPDWLGLNPTNKSLDDYLTNPNVYDYTGLKGDVLKKAAADDAGQYADQNLKTVLGHNVVPFKKLLTKYRGASINETLSAIHDNFDSKTANAMTTVLHNIRETTMDKYGVKDKLSNDPEQIRKAYEYIDSGILSAMGKTEQGTIDDSYNERLALQNARATKTPSPPTLPKIPMSYSPSISDKTEYDRLNNVMNQATGNISKSEYSKASPSYMGFASQAYSETGTNDAIKKSQQEIYNLAKQNGIVPPAQSRTGNMDKTKYNNFVKQVIDAQQNKLKMASPTYTIATGDDNIGKTIYQALQSGVTTLPKSGSTQLTTTKYLELKKKWGSPIVTFSPMGEGVSIKFGDGSSFKTDNSIFQSDLTSKHVDNIVNMGKSIRPLILDLKGNLKNLKKHGNNYIVEMSKFGGNDIGFSKDEIDNGIKLNDGSKMSVEEYLKNTTANFNSATLEQLFPNFAAQNQGMDINAWSDNKKLKDQSNLYNPEE